MVKRVLLAKASVSYQEDPLQTSEEPLELEYYMTVSEPERYQVNDGEEVYGMLVSKKIGEGMVEEEAIRYYSFNREDTINLVKKLAANRVTPIELPYIIDDILGT